MRQRHKDTARGIAIGAGGLYAVRRMRQRRPGRIRTQVGNWLEMRGAQAAEYIRKRYPRPEPTTRFGRVFVRVKGHPAGRWALTKTIGLGQRITARALRSRMLRRFLVDVL